MSLTIKVPDNIQSSQPTGDLGVLPKGTYSATIYEVKPEEVRSGANAGKPRWNVQFRISAGEYENRRVFAYIPLYVAGDFWKTQNFFESLGFDVKGDFTVPAPKDILGKPVDVRVTVREAQGDYPEDNNVAGFNKPTPGSETLLSMGAKQTSDLWVE